MTIEPTDLIPLLDWAYRLGKIHEGQLNSSSLAYSELLAEYDLYREEKGEEAVKL